MLLGESMPEIESAALAIFTPSGAIHDPPHGCGVAAVAELRAHQQNAVPINSRLGWIIVAVRPLVVAVAAEES